MPTGSGRPYLNLAFEHSIDTTTDKPVVGRPYRTSWTARCFLLDQVAKMLIDDVIEPSGNKCLSMVVLVEKKDGKKRLCVNCKALNVLTLRDVYPLPPIADTLNALACAQLFIFLDCQAGFWQISVSMKDRHETAFATPNSCYRFRVMPFGLLNSSSTYQNSLVCRYGDYPGPTHTQYCPGFRGCPHNLRSQHQTVTGATGYHSRAAELRDTSCHQQ